MRRDAQARREALLSAAADCFRDGGFTVPLEQIAERAGVGRGTLYRNFADRFALAIAIFEREIDAAEAHIDPTAPIGETLLLLVRQGAQASSLFQRIAVDIPLTDENRARFEALRQRMARLMEPVAARGHADGSLRQDVTADDLVLAIRMLSGLVKHRLPDDEMEVTLGAALPLLLRGLLP
ncbi:TetR/AcrR family transcriptional regulator [Sphingomonas sp. XXL09]|uniref:TetR/AcrR family transcriptional regulator n=1 Tax=Sphingomonas sp. XXL09 TaxID=3457787 RepID=UPI00406BA5D9